MSEKIINVARDFSRFPAGRRSDDGPYSGERFRETVLRPALEEYENVIIDLNGVLGYGSSFLEEAFGGLVRNHGISPESFFSKVRLVSNDPIVLEEIREYLIEAEGGLQ